jgi:hypothetical protein
MRQAEGQGEKKIKRHEDWRTKRQTEKQAEKQADRQTKRQAGHEVLYQTKR